MYYITPLNLENDLRELQIQLRLVDDATCFRFIYEILQDNPQEDTLLSELRRGWRSDVRLRKRFNISESTLSDLYNAVGVLVESPSQIDSFQINDDIEKFTNETQCKQYLTTNNFV